MPSASLHSATLKVSSAQALASLSQTLRRSLQHRAPQAMHSAAAAEPAQLMRTMPGRTPRNDTVHKSFASQRASARRAKQGSDAVSQKQSESAAPQQPAAARPDSPAIEHDTNGAGNAFRSVGLMPQAAATVTKRSTTAPAKIDPASAMGAIVPAVLGSRCL